MATNRQPAADPSRNSKRLRMVEHFIVETGPQAIQLRSATRVARLKGAMVDKVLPHVLPLLDGTLSAEELVTRCAAVVSASNARTVLSALMEKGFIEEVTPTDPG